MYNDRMMGMNVAMMMMLHDESVLSFCKSLKKYGSVEMRHNCQIQSKMI